jgi:hypothetical protein
MNSPELTRGGRARYAGTGDVVALLALAAPWVAAALLPAIGQPQSYHDFADRRVIFGAAHAVNVLSNIPFLVIGALGLFRMHALTVATRQGSVALPYRLLFTGTLLTAFGSAWYHAAPSDATLVWDRLPIALGFAGLVAGALADRAPRRTLALSVAFATVALATVLTWSWSGNLVPYIAMQATFIATALYAAARLPSRFTNARWLYGAAAVYALAVVCERFDHAIDLATGGFVSGHTLKHLLAAVAIYVVYRMLSRRGLTGPSS